MKKMWKVFVPVILLVASCSPDTSRPIIPEDKMADILEEYYKVQSASLQHPIEKDGVVNYYGYIFEKYHYTEAEFDSSVTWYTSHMDVFEKVYEVVMERLEAQENSWAQKLTDESSQK